MFPVRHSTPYTPVSHSGKFVPFYMFFDGVKEKTFLLKTRYIDNDIV